MPPKASRAPGGATSTRRDWGHPDGMPLWEVEENQVYHGRVTNTQRLAQGVSIWVDFGAVKDGLLRVSGELNGAFRKGQELDVLVAKCDADEGKVTLELPEDELPELPPRRPAGARAKSASAAGSAGTRRAQSRRRKWDHNEATPLEELTDGDVFEGVVTNVSPSGVFVDVGAVRDARLNVRPAIGRRFRVGDVVENCMLEGIDPERGRMAASLPDPEEAVRDLPPKERPPRSARSASRARRPKAKPQPQQRSEPPQRPEQRQEMRSEQRPEQDSGLHLEDLEVGALCDGVVARSNQYGVFVSIGCEKDAKLQVPKKLQRNFRRGDEIYGMRIEKVDLENKQLAVSLDDPELSVEEEMEEVAPAPAPVARPAKAAPAAKRAASATPAKAAPKPNAKSAAPKAKPKAAPVENASGRPITRFRVGSTANGTVTRIAPQGVYVDIGAVTDGLLKLPRAVAKQFQVNDEVHGMTVEELAVDANRVILSLDDPELEEAYVPAPSARAALPRQEPSSGSRQNGKAPVNGRSSEEKSKSKVAEGQPKAPVRAKGKAKEQAAEGRDSGFASGRVLLEDLEPGTEVSGVVTGAHEWGVFVDVGAAVAGKLHLTYRDWRSFRKGEELKGLEVEDVDLETESIWLRFVNGDEEAYSLEEQHSAAAAQAALPAAPSSRSTTSKATGPRRAAAESSASGARPTSQRTAPMK